MKKFALIMFAFLFAFALPFAVVGCNNQEYESVVKYDYIGYTCQQKGEGQYVYVFELRVKNNTTEDVDLVKSEYQVQTQWRYRSSANEINYWDNTTFHIFVGEINQNEILVSSTLKSRCKATLFITTDILYESRTNTYGYNETLKKIEVRRGTEVIYQISH